MTLGAAAAALITAGLVIGTVKDIAPFTWRWDVERMAAENQRDHELFTQAIRDNEVAILEVTIDRVFRDRLAVSEARRACEMQQTQPSQACAQLLRDEQILEEQEQDSRDKLNFLYRQ